MASAHADGILQHTLVNPNGPPVLAYAWIGPFVGAAIRPVGGWISDKLGGSIVTQWVCAAMVVAGVAVGYVMQLAYQSATPEDYFFIFLALFIVLFSCHQQFRLCACAQLHFTTRDRHNHPTGF